MTETTGINLLPLPHDLAHLTSVEERRVKAYVSANVVRATGLLLSEIEELQARVDFLDSVIATHAADTREYQKRISQAEARAGQLAEAVLGWWEMHRPAGWTEDQHRACPHVNLATDAEKALVTAMLREQEEQFG